MYKARVQIKIVVVVGDYATTVLNTYIVSIVISVTKCFHIWQVSWPLKLLRFILGFTNAVSRRLMGSLHRG